MEQNQYRYIAHSANSNGEEQSMKQHCVGVAKLMKSFALANDFEEIYSYCGLLHDLGKYSSRFQNYIRSNGAKEPHAKWGAYMARKNKLINIAFPVIGHHAGLPNRDAMFEDLEICAKEENKWNDIQQALEEDEAIIPVCDNSPFDKIGDIFQKELFIHLEEGRLCKHKF